MQALEERELFWYEKVQLEGQQIGRQIGFQEGQSVGQQIGQQIGQHKILLRQLKRKFGALPADFLQQFEAINDPDLLDEIGDRLLTAQSLDQVLLPLAA